MGRSWEVLSEDSAKHRHNGSDKNGEGLEMGRERERRGKKEKTKRRIKYVSATYNIEVFYF